MRLKMNCRTSDVRLFVLYKCGEMADRSTTNGFMFILN